MVSADLAPADCPRSWIVLAFVVPLVVYAALVPRFLLYSSPPTGDQPFYLLMTASLVQDADLDLRNNYESRDYGKFYERAPRPPGFVGMTAPDPLPPTLARTVRPPEEWYDPRSPGLSALLVPAWIVGSWVSLWWPATVVFTCVIGALVAVNVFLLAHELTGRRWAAFAVWAPLAFSNPLMSYSYLLFTELATGLFVVYAFRRLALGWKANGKLRLVLVGSSIGLVPWLSWRCVPVALALAAYAIVQWRRARGDARSAAWLLTPAVVAAALLGWYNAFLFGNPLVGGSQRVESPPPFNWPWLGVHELRAFVTNTFGLLFDRQMGLLTHTPLYVLAAAGLIGMLWFGRPSDRRLVAWLTIVSAPYIAIVASFQDWNGIWSPPARYQTVLVPLAAVPLGFTLMAWRHWPVRALYGLLALPGLLLMAVRMYDARFMWPVQSVFRWVADNLHVDVVDWLPLFLPFERDSFARGTAWMTLVSIVIVVFCVLQPRGEWPPGSQAVRGLQVRAAPYLLTALAVVAVGLAWLFMNHDLEGAAS